MRRFCVLEALLLLAVSAQPIAQSPPRSDEMLTIDGSKNPELIPQWSSWGYAFRIFSGGPRELPTSVLLHVSKDEAQLVMKESDNVQKIDRECVERLIKTYELLKTGEAARSVDTKMHAITVECRWKTLHARDRILAGLNPEARLALVAFVEDTKRGVKVLVPKAGLARYLEPQ